AGPASLATAQGANRVDFTATSVDICGTVDDDFCQAGEAIVLPNGKRFVVGYQTIMMFTASDPRWNAKCLFSGDMFPIGNPKAYPVSGSFVCTPTAAEYAGGWWEGSVRQVLMPDKMVGTWNGKGYGTFDGLLVTTYNTMSSKFNDLPPTTTNVGVIIELPGYQP
ncbi:MAG: hypothetical protein IH586_08835, partial [Anaerolineaceae bacterium]|nr:hypothetical protein [Anaerolineaceae bacterium]